MATMSEKYRRVIRTRLTQERDGLRETIRTIELLQACEHPDWGEPGAKTAHKAALAVIRRQERQPQKGLSEAVISHIRMNDRKNSGLALFDAHFGDPYFVGKNFLRSPRSLRPSSLELSKQELPTLHFKPDPEYVALPDQDEDELNDLREGPSPAPPNATTPSCKTVTTRALATLMRLHDRCHITVAGLRQLKELLNTTLKQIKQIDVSQRSARDVLKERTQLRFMRSWGPEFGGDYYKTIPLGLAGGFGSQLSRYTAAKDADDPWGQRDARWDMVDLWVPESNARQGDVKW